MNRLNYYHTKIGKNVLHQIRKFFYLANLYVVYTSMYYS